jgi:hypothetical protein
MPRSEPDNAKPSPGDLGTGARGTSNAPVRCSSTYCCHGDQEWIRCQLGLLNCVECAAPRKVLNGFGNHGGDLIAWVTRVKARNTLSALTSVTTCLGYQRGHNPNVR